MTEALDSRRLLKALIALNVILYGVYFCLPLLPGAQSPVEARAFELNGYGGWVAADHPLAMGVSVAVRLLAWGAIVFNFRLAALVFTSVLLVEFTLIAIGGLVVLSAIDMLLLAALGVCDGALLLTLIQRQTKVQRD